VVAVGGVVIDAVPEPVKEFAVRVFYVNDKLALVVGIGVLLVALAAGAGVLARRRLAYGLAGVGLLGVVGAAAAVTRPGAHWWWVLPSLVGAAAGALALVRLIASAGTAEPGDRRSFLTLAGGALGVAALVGTGAHWLANRRGVEEARREVALPTPSGSTASLPGEADLRVPELSPFVTSADDFYLIDTAIIAPQVDPGTWKLRIHGRVRRPMTLTFAQLLARPTVERYITLACVSNEVGGGLIGNARWLGVPIKDLLDEAEPLDGADQVVSRSVDGFTAGTPTAVLRDGRDALLAIGMNGAPLPVKHGFPVRMVVPGLYGYVSATKWLAELELSSFDDFDAYWIKRGWAAQAPIKTASRIDTPQRQARTGRVAVAGVAWAQHRGISKVEVRVDDGPWRPATLAAVPSVDTWRQWRWDWDAPKGRHRLQVRATDNGGQTQTEEAQPSFPDGATGYHTVEVTVD
jgi:DMSO/TMAO reductase YedYZ molybdopterin-dependent catalytic subunit